MDIREIVTRKTDSEFHESELIFVVEEFIKERKGAEVKINLLKNIDVNHPFAAFALQTQYQNLMVAFDRAREWYVQNKFTA